MRIIDFVPYYPPHIGGLEKYTQELHSNLAKKGCRITVFTPRIPKDAAVSEKFTDINIIRYPAFEIIFNYPLPCFWQRAFWHQYRKLFREEFDLTISASRFFVQPLFALFFARRKKLPIVHIEHCSDYVKNKPLISLIALIYDKTLGRFALSRADKIIAVSQAVADFVRHIAKRDSVVIYKGLPFDEIEGTPADISCKNQFTDKKIVTFIGRLIFGKGVLQLLKAAASMKRDDFVILIIGDGPERENLKKFVQDNGLSGKIRFFGSLPFEKAIEIMKITDILVNPSYNEGLPTSVLEAGACGSAIIATDVGGTKEIIRNNHSGIIIKPYDPDSIKNSIEKLLDDDDFRNFLAKNAKEDIEKKFNWERATQTYLEEIRSLINK